LSFFLNFFVLLAYLLVTRYLTLVKCVSREWFWFCGKSTSKPKFFYHSKDFYWQWNDWWEDGRVL